MHATHIVWKQSAYRGSYTGDDRETKEEERHKKRIRKEHTGVKIWKFGAKSGNCQETEGQKRPNYFINQYHLLFLVKST